MSAQGGTLQRRGTIELPIWPVAVLVIAAVAAAIGMTLLDGAGQTTFVTSVTDIERLSHSTAAVREQGAVAPAIPAIRPIDLSVLENSSAAIREQGAALPAIVGISHVTPRLSAPTSVGPVGLENAGAYLPQTAAYPSGLENPTAYVPSEVAPTVAGPATGIMVNGTVCHQCR